MSLNSVEPTLGQLSSPRCAWWALLHWITHRIIPLGITAKPIPYYMSHSQLKRCLRFQKSVKNENIWTLGRGLQGAGTAGVPWIHQCYMFPGIYGRWWLPLKLGWHNCYRMFLLWQIMKREGLTPQSDWSQVEYAIRQHHSQQEVQDFLNYK